MTDRSGLSTPQGVYTPEMQTEMDRLQSLITETVDFSRAPDTTSRALDRANNGVWNVDLPEVMATRRLLIPADDELGSAATEAVEYVPADAGEGLIFFVHGGGWAFMNLETHERFMRLLCIEAKTTVVGVHYRLAPENPFPASLMDVVSAFRKVMSARTELGLPAGPVVIAGDSAGGNLALATMLHEIDAGRELPVGALLFYGVFGADFETPSYKDYADGHALTKAIMRQLWDWYVPDPAARNDPLAAPLVASDVQLQALPPLFLVSAEVDPLASDTTELMAKLAALGRTDTLWFEPGVIHGFLQMTAFLEAARRTTREAARAALGFIADGKNVALRTSDV
jgi:acetyl esterase